ncbi:hypothetical protein ES332_D01G138000v1 [Gossypium tomentosum]|uniref:Uncharacterized protein n=1 Tax=Gossypium tomentosum TaxID=34277 RepID=A0A5D2M8V9_GOSTO|nr:hypothetical protein ES332_D01G138000v1 [Gossypium tomentosum]
MYRFISSLSNLFSWGVILFLEYRQGTQSLSGGLLLNMLTRNSCTSLLPSLSLKIIQKVKKHQ